MSVADIEKITDILRSLLNDARRSGESSQIVDNGEVVAHIVPSPLRGAVSMTADQLAQSLSQSHGIIPDDSDPTARAARRAQTEAVLVSMDELAEKIAKVWPEAFQHSMRSMMSAATSSRLSVVNASVWVARYLPQDRFHLQSRDWFDAWVLDDGELVAPILVLGEVGGAIARQTGDSTIGLEAVAEIERNPVLVLIDLDAALGELTARIATTLRLRGADAVYAALAHRLALPLITWDRELISRSEKMFEARTPADTSPVTPPCQPR